MVNRAMLEPDSRIHRNSLTSVSHDEDCNFHRTDEKRRGAMLNSARSDANCRVRRLTANTLRSRYSS